jgi:MFS transporter, DHA2 family, multidrug resistance protein
MVSRFVGAAVGVAVVGSILSSVFSDHLGHAADGLAKTQADAADGSLQGALEVATTLPRADAHALTAAARDAFDAGAFVGYVVITIVAAGAALWAWHALRNTSS